MDSLSYSALPTPSQHQPPLPSAFNHCRSRSLWMSPASHMRGSHASLCLSTCSSLCLDGSPFLNCLVNSGSSPKLSPGFISSGKHPLTFLPTSATHLLRYPVLCSQVFLYRDAHKNAMPGMERASDIAAGLMNQCSRRCLLRSLRAPGVRLYQHPSSMWVPKEEAFPIGNIYP